MNGLIFLQSGTFGVVRGVPEIIATIAILVVFFALGIGIGYLVLRHLANSRESAGVGGINTLFAWEKKSTPLEKKL